MRTINTKPKVAFIYHFMPDYREPVFRALKNDPTIDAEFIAGTELGSFSSVPDTKAIPFRRARNRWMGPLLWQSGMLAQIRQNEYDVVVFRGSWLTLSTWVGALYARSRGIPVLFWLIGWRRPESGLRGFLRPRYLRLAHGLLLYGERSKTLGEQHGYPADRMHVIGNSLPFTTAGIEEIQEPVDSTLVLWITRILPYKKPELLLDAIGIAKERGHELECVFVGNGDTTPLDARVTQWGIGKQVAFVGRIDHQDPEQAALFARARVVAVPGHAGLTVANGLVNGVPVVVNDNPNANPPEWEYVHQPDGLPENTRPNGSHFEEDNAESLATELIRWCIEEPANTTHKREIAENARFEVSPQRSSDAIVKAVFHYLKRHK